MIKKKSLFDESGPQSSVFSRFTMAPPPKQPMKVVEEEEDPFDAYMKQIEGEAVA